MDAKLFSKLIICSWISYELKSRETSLYKFWLVTEIKYQSFCLYPDMYINISPKQGESKKYNYRVCRGTHVKFIPIKLFYREIIKRNYRTVGFFFSINRLMMTFEDLRTQVLPVNSILLNGFYLGEFSYYVKCTYLRIWKTDYVF